MPSARTALLLPCCLLLIVSLLPSTVAAQAHRLADVVLVPLEEDDVEEEDEFISWSTDFDYRFWGNFADANSFDADARTRDGGFQRLRTGAGLRVGPVSGTVNLDLLSGRLFGGDPAPVDARIEAGTDPHRAVLSGHNETIVDPRELYMSWESEVGEFRLGLQTSQWGLGLLANDGGADGEGLFNQAYGGDRVFRALFATAPFRPLSSSDVIQNLYLVLGADLVYRDENASSLAGDQAYQGVTALFYRNAQTMVGTYAAYRKQRDEDESLLDVLALDVHADHTWYSDDATFAYRVAGEAAYLWGSTTRAFAQDAEPLKVKALGLATEVEVRHRPTSLAMKTLAGYASGDANNDDDTLYRFRFDPNYKVGLVLFEHYMPSVHQASLDRLSNPEQSGQAPTGADQLVSNGSVADAFYINPQLLVGDPNGLMGGLGLLWAHAATTVSDPYGSFAQGGVPRGVRGRETATRSLGWELDVAARYRHQLPWLSGNDSQNKPLTLEIKAEYGIFFPGSAFDDELGNSDAAQSLIRGRMAIIW